MSIFGNMKHLVFVSNEISPDKGGIQNMCYYVSDALSSHYEVTVICTSDSQVSDKLVNHIVKSRYSSKNYNSFRRDVAHLICKVHRTKTIDYILYAQYSLSSYSVFISLIKQIPYIILGHGNELYGNVGKSTIKTIFLNRQRRFIFDKANLIIANSQFTKGLVNSITRNKNIVVIHPPVKEVTIDNGIIQSEPYRIFSISRLVKRKGLQLVIRAVAKLVHKFPLIHYYIAGSGDYESNLRLLVEQLGLENNISFLGRVTEEEKQIQYQKCALFVMPSFSIPSDSSVEGFGIVFLEANAYGKFVIGSHSGGIPDAINEGVTGLLAKENDVDSVTTCIDNFFSNNRLYNPSACYEWAKYHSKENIALQYKQMIDNVI